ncbi:hypothetical protein V8F06_004001 [Rhypophila decipiens]
MQASMMIIRNFLCSWLDYVDVFQKQAHLHIWLGSIDLGFVSLGASLSFSFFSFASYFYYPRSVFTYPRTFSFPMYLPPTYFYLSYLIHRWKRGLPRWWEIMALL